MALGPFGECIRVNPLENKMNKKVLTLSATSFLLALPGIGVAVELLPQPGVIGFSAESLFSALFNLIWPFFAAYAVIMYILAAFQFFNAQGDPSKVKDAMKSVIWGSVGVAVGILSFSIPFLIGALLT